MQRPGFILEDFGSAGPPPCDMVKGGGASNLGAWAWRHATLSYIRLPSCFRTYVPHFTSRISLDAKASYVFG